MDLSLIWAAIIVVGVVTHVIMDRFDLDIGALFLWVRDEDNRSLMMASAAPVWDGNETWPILAGLNGAVVVAAGAMAAHVSEGASDETIATAARYQMRHALALLTIE